MFSMLTWAGWGVGASLVSSTIGLGTLGWVFVIGAPVRPDDARPGTGAPLQPDRAPGHLALTAGDPRPPIASSPCAREKFRWPAFLRRLGDYNRAFALIREGQFDTALELLSDLDRRGGVLNLDGAVAGAFALAHALAGHVELADDWLAETRRRYGQYKMTGFACPRSPYAYPKPRSELRAGEAEVVRNRLGNEWTQLENSVTGNIFRPMRVLRAFALAQSSGPRDAAIVDSLLSALRGTSTRDIEYLGAAWPEMHVFMSAHGLIQA